MDRAHEGLRACLSVTKAMISDLQAFAEILEALDRGEQVNLKCALSCFAKIWKVAGRLDDVLKRYPFQSLIHAHPRLKDSP
jgi:hypothetical protein